MNIDLLASLLGLSRPGAGALSLRGHSISKTLGVGGSGFFTSSYQAGPSEARMYLWAYGSIRWNGTGAAGYTNQQTDLDRIAPVLQHNGRDLILTEIDNALVADTLTISQVLRAHSVAKSAADDVNAATFAIPILWKSPAPGGIYRVGFFASSALVAGWSVSMRTQFFTL